MKIKKPFYMLGLVMAATLSTTSCSDFLEIEPLNEITLGKFWNEESDVNNVVLGCYSALQTQSAVSRMLVWGEFRSDNVVAGVNIESDASLQRLLKENITASNAYTTWADFYDVINRCNTVLYYAPQVAEKDPNYTQTELRATQAEVKALRALCYFYLIRTFKDVPFLTEPVLDDNQEMPMQATPFDEILAALITDLEGVRDYAVKKYPDSNSYAQRGRITQNAIDALLCEMCLWQKNYAKSVEYADKVISSYTSDYQQKLDNHSGSGSSLDPMIDGYPLISESMLSGYYGSAYNDIFGDGCSRESIFELVYMDDDTYLSNGAVNVYYGNQDVTVGYVKPADAVCQDISAERYEVYRDKYDTRYYECVNEASASNYGVYKYASSMAMIQVSGSTVKSTGYSAYTKDMCRANFIVYRLTDVMLLKAEALVQEVNGAADTIVGTDKAKLEEALAIVNAVSKRSCCSSTYTPYAYSNYSSKTAMEQLVMDERRRELMFEGKRWYDLVRRARREGNSESLKSAVSKKGVENLNKLSVMDAIYWPYNQDELKVNSQLKQNPAYDTASN